MEMKTLTINGQTFTVSDPDAVTRDQFDALVADLAGELSEQYDLKDGYGYTADVYIAEDGTETALTGQNYKCVDYIPVRAGVSYTMYGVGYALYDEEKAFVSATIDESGENLIREFTPAVHGYVRLTINSADILYARFCRTSEKDRELRDYEPKLSPFFDPAIPCDVHLYGDSNSEGYGLDDPSKAWSNRLGALITGMVQQVYSWRLSGFAGKVSDKTYYYLGTGGELRLTVYTNMFLIRFGYCGEVSVTIDGVQQEAIGEGNSKQYDVDWGYHTIVLRGVSGENIIQAIATNKQRTFTNHAVYGNNSGALPAAPDGNVAIVMLGTNDRVQTVGSTARSIWNFVRACKAAGATYYVFTPVPTAVAGETSEYSQQMVTDVIAQLPPDCINVYKDLQLIEVLTGETIFADDLHLNERGHKLLYAIAASKLQLAALNSELAEEG